MLPIEWISDSTQSKRVRVLFQTSSASGEWKTLWGVTEKRANSARYERLHYVLAELAGNEDTLGLTHVLKSMVVHWEYANKSQNVFVSKIRLEKGSDPKPMAADASTASSDETETILYEAALARFAGGEFGFVPKIENHRSVRSLKGSEAPK